MMAAKGDVYMPTFGDMISDEQRRRNEQRLANEQRERELAAEAARVQPEVEKFGQDAAAYLGARDIPEATFFERVEGRRPVPLTTGWTLYGVSCAEGGLYDRVGLTFNGVFVDLATRRGDSRSPNDKGVTGGDEVVLDVMNPMTAKHHCDSGRMSESVLNLAEGKGMTWYDYYSRKPSA